MKLASSFAIVMLLVASIASALVPISQLEQLRQQSIVVRVASDYPKDNLIKDCGLKNESEKLVELGSKLHFNFDAARMGWEARQIDSADLPLIASGVARCRARASCATYESFLDSVKVAPDARDKVAAMQTQVKKLSAAMTSSDYLRASRPLQSKCQILKAMLGEGVTQGN